MSGHLVHHIQFIYWEKVIRKRRHREETTNLVKNVTTHDRRSDEAGHCLRLSIPSFTQMMNWLILLLLYHHFQFIWFRILFVIDEILWAVWIFVNQCWIIIPWRHLSQGELEVRQIRLALLKLAHLPWTTTTYSDCYFGRAISAMHFFIIIPMLAQ